MKKISIISLLSIVTLLNCNTDEQTRFLQNIADKTNAKIKRIKNFPRSTTHISYVTAEEDYTLNITFQTNFSDKNKVDNFKILNIIKMKRKFCMNEFYEKMKDGLVISFSYYTPKNELITYFELDEESCKEANLVYSSIRYNPN